MTKKENVQVGDIALVSVEDGVSLPIKVLYLSKRYKDVILIAIYKQRVETESMPDLFGEPLLLVYTSQLAITRGRWKSVGNVPLADNEKGKAKRIVAGAVWIDDDEIRPATETDYRELPEMLVLGSALVEKKARQLISDE